MKTGKLVISTILFSAALFVLFLITGGLFGFFSNAAYAAVGTINGTSYDSFNSLVNAVKDMDGQTFTIEMTGNWDAGVDNQFDKRLIIPKNSRVTLNMNGWVFDRSRVVNNDWTSNGELICVESGASLTVNGGSQKTLHIENVYSAANKDNKATSTQEFYGGVLTGGASTNGAGGIYIKGNVTLTLNDVTIAGCRAEKYGWDGYGGGIWISDDNCTVKLNNSTITGCFAYVKGGGIYASNDDNIRIELVNSHVDGNYALDDGGGICLDGEKVLIKGDENSTISGNVSLTNGGGILLNNDEATVKGTGEGLQIKGNKAKNGGGIYTVEETIVLSNLVLSENEAREGNGGGVLVYNDITTITDCSITSNLAGQGGGVFASSGISDPVDSEFLVSGSTVIRENFDVAGNRSNLRLPDESVRVMLDLKKGADVWIGYSSLPESKGKSYYMVTEGTAGDTIKNKNCLRYLSMDQLGHHITYNSAPNYRKIFFVCDGCTDSVVGNPYYLPDPPQSISVSEAAPQVSGRVKAGGEKNAEGEFDLIRGIYKHQKTDTGTDDRYGVFYYSDGLFYGENPSYTYNDHLATASLVMAFAGMYLNRFQEEDAVGNIYYNKHAAARQFMADIGCPDQNIYVNDLNVKKPGTDTIGVTIASKNLMRRGSGGEAEETGDILIPIVTRGGGYEAEYASNLTMGNADNRNGEYQGFSDAADQVMGEVEHYIAKYNLESALAEGRVKFWVAGYSRGGATANIVSKRLVEQFANGAEGSQNEVFGYTFEAPKGGSDNAQTLEPSAYFCIHNTVNAADFIPLWAPEEMGFKRYGVDHYSPGTATGTPKETRVTLDTSHSTESVKTVTTYADNDPMLTKTSEYEALRSQMEAYLLNIDADQIFDDYFHPMAMNFFPRSVYETGGYDNTRVEDFIRDFFAILQEGNGRADWTALPGRNQFATYQVTINGTNYPTLQHTLRDFCALVFSLSEDDSSGIVERASTIMDSISKITWFWSSEVTMRELYANVIGAWYKRTDAEKAKYINFFWNALKETKAFDYLSESDTAMIEKSWPTLADMAFRFVDADYNVHPGDSDHNKSWAGGSSKSMMYVPTFMTFAGYIIMNHYPEVNLAWLHTRDNYYAAENSGYTVDEGSFTPTAPSASVNGAELKPEGQVNSFQDDVKIILDAEAMKGEAIYYSLYDETNRKWMEQNQIYRGGIDLQIGTEVKDYTLRIYDMAYGRRSAETVYNLRMGSGRHVVNVYYGARSLEDYDYKETFTYKEGDTVRLTARSTGAYGKLNGKYFNKWILQESGTDRTEDLLGGQSEEAVIEFVMPSKEDISSETAWPEFYTLDIIADYKDRIQSLQVSNLDGPVPGQMLDQTATIEFNNGVTKEYPVSWRYLSDQGNTIVASQNETAYGSTEYHAWINIDADKGSDVMFVMQVAVTDANGIQKNCTINLADGSLDFEAGTFTTAEGDSADRQGTDRALTIREIDQSTGVQDPDTAPASFHVLEGSVVTLTAPAVQDEVFIGWTELNGELGVMNGSAFEGSGIRLEEGSSARDRMIHVKIPEGVSAEGLAVDALYAPVIRSVQVTIDEPKVKTALSGTAKVSLQITHEYEISPEFIQVSWAPEAGSGTADYMTGYTATVQVVPKYDESGPYVEVRPAGTEEAYVRQSPYFFYSDNLSVTVNGREGAVCDMANNRVSITFEPLKYKLVSVKQPDSIRGLPYGADPNAYLPDNILVVRDDGSEAKVSVTWDAPVKVSDEGELSEVVWNVAGAIHLPESIMNPDSISEQVFLTITAAGAETVSSPKASIESGTFLSDQAITLSTETEGAQIYYTTNGESSGTQSTLYQGEFIEIRRGDATEILDALGNPTGEKAVTVRAVAMKEGMLGSAEACWQYVFSNQVPVRVTFRVLNGAWNDLTTADKTVTLLGEGEDPPLLAAEDIPAAGDLPEENFKAGGWDTVPEAGQEVRSDTTFTYTYAPDDSIPKPEFRMLSLLLSGKIGVNFFVELPEGVNSEGSYMTFDITGRGSVTERADLDPGFKDQTTGTFFGFTCYINSVQMADKITATFHYPVKGEEFTVEKRISVKDYLNAFDAVSGSFDASTTDLLHALSDYGHYVQPFLASARGWRIGEDYAEMDKKYAESFDIEGIRAASNAYMIGIENNTGGDITEVFHSLTMDSDTVLNVYFKPAASYEGTFTASVDGGADLTYSKGADGRYCVQISGIAAHELSKPHVISVTTADGHTMTVQISALSYVNLALNYYQGSTDADLTARNAAASIWAYSQAANAYKAAHPGQ